MPTITLNTANNTALVKNKNFQPGQPAVVVLHGIGEQVKEKTLANMIAWKGWDTDPNKLEKSFFDATDEFGVNYVMVQSKDESIGDIDLGIKVALEDLKADPKRIRLFGVSWGGRRINNWLGANPDNAKKISGFVAVAPGGEGTVNTGQYIADAMLPGWYFHAINDSTTTYKHSLIPYQAARRANPKTPVYYTEYKADSDPKNDHNIIGLVVNAWGKYDGNWLPANSGNTNSGPANEYTNEPKMSIYQWWEMNERVGPTDPETAYIAGPVVVPEPAPVPTKKLVKTIELYDDGTYTER